LLAIVSSHSIAWIRALTIATSFIVALSCSETAVAQTTLPTWVSKPAVTSPHFDLRSRPLQMRGLSFDGLVVLETHPEYRLTIWGLRLSTSVIRFFTPSSPRVFVAG